jgi:hypothetical protein
MSSRSYTDCGTTEIGSSVARRASLRFLQVERCWGVVQQDHQEMHRKRDAGAGRRTGYEYRAVRMGLGDPGLTIRLVLPGC